MKTARRFSPQKTRRFLPQKFAAFYCHRAGGASVAALPVSLRAVFADYHAESRGGKLGTGLRGRATGKAQYEIFVLIYLAFEQLFPPRAF